MDITIGITTIILATVIAWRPIQRAIEARQTRNRLYRLCAMRNTFTALDGEKVRERANVA
jgi:hypothetical protein